MIIGVLKKLYTGAARLCDFTARFTEYKNRRFFQQYGLVSMPLEGAEVVGFVQGDVVIIVGSEDRRYRLAVESGDVALYDNRGSKIHLQDDGKIVIESSGSIEIKSAQIDLGTVTNKLMTSTMISIYNAHTHTIPGGTSGPPSALLIEATHATNTTKAE